MPGQPSPTISRGNPPERISSGAAMRLAWVLAVVAWGLVLVAAALVLDLHNQKRRLENLSEHLKQVDTVRETESKSLTARYATAGSALVRLRELYKEREADLKRFGDAYTQREPVMKQATEAYEKFQLLARDLLDLSKTDADAREVVRKYNIQQNTQASGAAAPKPPKP